MGRQSYIRSLHRSEEEVPCPRLARPLPISEHCRCLYCFGDEEAVRSGSLDRFCDFRPDKDPIAFGFPATFGRYQHYV